MATAENPSLRECPRCGARWFDGQLRWATGKPGKEADLAGLVCQRVNDPRCINPGKDQQGGQTWESRLAGASLMAVSIEQMQQQAQHRGR
jgi:hypothetical protein